MVKIDTAMEEAGAKSASPTRKHLNIVAVKKKQQGICKELSH